MALDNPTFSSGSGTVDPDLFLGKDDSVSLNGALGPDVLIGNYGTVVLFNSDNMTTHEPYNFDTAFTWRTDENPLLFDNGVTPYVSVHENDGRGDRYQIHLDAGQIITVDIDYGGTLGIDQVVEITTVGGTVLANGDDSPTDAGGLGSISNRDPFVTFTAPASGTYYVNIHPFGTPPDNFTPYPYLLNVSVSGHTATTTVPGGSDTLSGGPGSDHLGGGPGNDQVSGNEDNDWLMGGSGDDTLDGGSGIDRMEGGSGNDTFFVDNAGDTVLEKAGEGTDIVVSSASYDLTANIENLALIGGADINGNGNSIANTITGNDAANAIFSGAGDDILIGKNGNDRLDGGLGADTMTGGLGNDSYFVDNLADTVSESAGEGTDTVNSNISYTLGANLEKLTLTGTGAINGTGNSLANVILGNSAANTLNGGGGDDTIDGRGGADRMYGGAGNDIYVIDNIGDRIAEASGQGIDTVKSSVSFEIGSNIENLTLTGGAAVSATGNSLANVLKGNSGANVLNGGGNADKMYGGYGNDTYIVDNAGDRVSEASGQGTDLVKSSVSFELASNVENLTLTGSAAVNATGNSGSNVIIGNSAANRITGGSGTDHLTGGGGADVFVFDDGHFGGMTASTCDEITDFTSGDLISLKAVDANSLVTGDQAFQLIGTSAFHNVAGELRYEQVAGNTFIYGDTNGDGLADFMLKLDGTHVLTAADIGL